MCHCVTDHCSLSRWINGWNVMLGPNGPLTLRPNCFIFHLYTSWKNNPNDSDDTMYLETILGFQIYGINLYHLMSKEVMNKVCLPLLTCNFILFLMWFCHDMVSNHRVHAPIIGIDKFAVIIYSSGIATNWTNDYVVCLYGDYFGPPLSQNVNWAPKSWFEKAVIGYMIIAFSSYYYYSFVY